MGFCSSKSPTPTTAQTRPTEATSRTGDKDANADDYSSNRRTTAASDSSDLVQESNSTSRKGVNSENPKSRSPSPSPRLKARAESGTEKRLVTMERRRLSVSTVHKGDDSEEPQKSPPKSQESQKSPKKVSSPSSSSSDHKQVDQISSPKGIQDVPSSMRSTVKHFSDPSLQLLNEKTGSIKDVSIEMIMDLVSNSISTYMVFGESPEGTQRGFDVRFCCIHVHVQHTCTCTVCTV